MNSKIVIVLLCCATACKTHNETKNANTNTTDSATGTAITIHSSLAKDGTAPALQKDTIVEEAINWSQRKYVAGAIFKPEEMAGCEYVIKMEDGQVLEPVNLVDSLKRNNLRIWLRYHPAETQVSVCMMGEIVMLDDVQYRK